MKKTLYLLFVGLLFVLMATGCTSIMSDKYSEAPPENTTPQKTEEPAPTAPPAEPEENPQLANAENPIVTIEMEDGSIMKLELYPKVAPNTVNNFISLVKKGYYNGLIFHRVIPGFMIQGGDPTGTGTGGPGYTIKGEFTQNGFENNFDHRRGVISMARAMDPNSAGSQFFIMHEDYPSLDGQYASFGKVIEGIEVVDKIVSVQKDQNDKPLKDQKMKKVTVETFGVNYPEPEKM